ncbi:hypothetical protein AURDEDRAFT_166439 [Auricularia subglabra TFB-10046 SS5]|uniref:Uncharacterized protein n=1 Tax=Auricularia subglabra (strain TFB-10046 / SS5) TaxID=717982 RepID=J0WZC3_AURST|nr:hypothetical protein AURDEDRAFT_166439 [Auricularia subglabra TFB-10046 SS5]
MSASATASPSVISVAAQPTAVDNAAGAQPPSYGASTAPLGAAGLAAPQTSPPGAADSATGLTTIQLIQEALRHLLVLTQQALTSTATTLEETARLNAEMRDVIRDLRGCIRDLTQLVDHNHDHVVDIESMVSTLAVKLDALGEAFRREGDMTRAEVHSHRVHFGEFIGTLGIRHDRVESTMNELRTGIVAHRDEFLCFAAVVNTFVAADKPAWDSVLQVQGDVATLHLEVNSLAALVKAYLDAHALRSTPYIDPALISMPPSSSSGYSGSSHAPASPPYAPISPTTSFSSQSSGGRREGTLYYPRTDRAPPSTPVVSRTPGRRHSFGEGGHVAQATPSASGYGPAAQN